MIKRRLALLGALAAIAAFAILAAGCRISPRVRTLPEEIQSIYVPMFINNSYEPGLEELATRSANEAFLADGRLNVVSPSQADVIVQGIIQSFVDESRSHESDKFPLMNTMSIKVQVKLYSPKDRLHPLNEYKPVSVSHSYVSDTRRMTSTIPEDALQSLMDGVGQQVVLEVLTGDFKSAAATAPQTDEAKESRTPKPEDNSQRLIKTLK